LEQSSSNHVHLGPHIVTKPILGTLICNAFKNELLSFNLMIALH